MSDSLLSDFAPAGLGAAFIWVNQRWECSYIKCNAKCKSSRQDGLRAETAHLSGLSAVMKVEATRRAMRQAARMLAMKPKTGSETLDLFQNSQLDHAAISAQPKASIR